MKLLREIFNNPKTVKFNDSSISVGGIDYSKSDIIKVEGTSKETYTLEQLAFFICNKELPYTKYLRECKTNGIASIFYSDQKIILDKINLEEESQYKAFCDSLESRYISKHDYNWVADFIKSTENSNNYKISEKYKIIVPSSLNAVINLNNIENFIKSGLLEKEKELIFDKHEFTTNIGTFVAEENIKNWTSNDWNMIVAIFCDGSEWQINEWGIGDVASLFLKIPTFYISNNENKLRTQLSNYNVKRIFVKDNVLSSNDYMYIIQEIQKRIDNMQ